VPGTILREPQGWLRLPYVIHNIPHRIIIVSRPFVHAIVLSSMIPQTSLVAFHLRGQRSFVLFHSLERPLGIMPYRATSESIEHSVHSSSCRVERREYSAEATYLATSMCHVLRPSPIIAIFMISWAALSPRGICPSRQSAASHTTSVLLRYCAVFCANIMPYSGFIARPTQVRAFVQL